MIVPRSFAFLLGCEMCIGDRKPSKGEEPGSLFLLMLLQKARAFLQQPCPLSTASDLFLRTCARKTVRFPVLWHKQTGQRRKPFVILGSTLIWATTCLAYVYSWSWLISNYKIVTVVGGEEEKSLQKQVSWRRRKATVVDMCMNTCTHSYLELLWRCASLGKKMFFLLEGLF